MLKPKTESTALFVWMLVCLVLAAGCDPFAGDPPPEVTSKPTEKQVSFCRVAMYINPNVEITPAGYFYQEHFLDDEAAFKFTVSVDSISEIFQSEFVPPKRLVARKSLGEIDVAGSPDWWDPDSKSLVGGEFTVPPPNSPGGNYGLRIGIANNQDGTYTVYVRWFET